jgi:hypothetical protein
MFRHPNFVWWPLGKAEKKNTRKKSSFSMLWHINLVWWPMGKDEKKRGCQSRVYMFWRVNFVWWRLAAKNPGCQSRGYMFWRVNFIWWRLGKAGKTQDVSLLFKVVYMFWRVIKFRCIDARISFDGHWAKPKRPRMSVWCLHVLTR